jgi:hypothetical protein
MCTLLHNVDFVLCYVSQTAAFTTNPATTAASPHEIGPKLTAVVGAVGVSWSAARTTSPAACLSTSIAINVTSQEEGGSLQVVG